MNTIFVGIALLASTANDPRPIIVVQERPAQTAVELPQPSVEQMLEKAQIVCAVVVKKEPEVKACVIGYMLATK